MISRISFSTLVLFGALTFSLPMAATAEEPWQEVRQALHDDCQRFRGHANGICMHAASATMANFSEESRSLYRSCLADGKPRSACDEEREEFWRNKLVF